MFNRRLLSCFDWGLFLGVLALMAIGFINLNSASAATGYPFQWKQLVWYGGGTALMLALVFLDYSKLSYYSLHIYIGTILLLVVVLLAGKTVGGSQRWLPLGFMNLQPSELAKLTVIIVLSSYFYNDDRPQYRLQDLWRPALLTVVPVLLIQRQPDLGTSLLLVAIMGSMVLMVRLRWTSFIIALLFVLAALPLGWKLLKPYQRSRIETFLNPESDPFGAGYHVLQSKIAIGSGGLFGKGYMTGTQAHLHFLPEVQTDFAFSIWAEEWGLIGSLFLLAVYAFVLYRGIRIASHSRERFGMFLAIGATAMLFWQTLVNIGMVLGLMPVVGMPLPLISYGGSSVITTLIAVGLLLSVGARRYTFQQGGMKDFMR